MCVLSPAASARPLQASRQSGTERVLWSCGTSVPPKFQPRRMRPVTGACCCFPSGPGCSQGVWGPWQRVVWSLQPLILTLTQAEAFPAPAGALCEPGQGGSAAALFLLPRPRARRTRRAVPGRPHRGRGLAARAVFRLSCCSDNRERYRRRERQLY